MGFKSEFNWVLKLNAGQGLNENEAKLFVGSQYRFSKNEHRIYPIETPIYLVNEKWQAIGMVVILKYTVGEGKTEGVYKVTKIFNDEEKKTISKSFEG